MVLFRSIRFLFYHILQSYSFVVLSNDVSIAEVFVSEVDSPALGVVFNPLSVRKFEM
jgi:hypothetical protein